MMAGLILLAVPTIQYGDDEANYRQTTGSDQGIRV